MFDMFLDAPLYPDRILKILIFIKRLLWERVRYVLAGYDWPLLRLDILFYCTQYIYFLNLPSSNLIFLEKMLSD